MAKPIMLTVPGPGGDERTVRLSSPDRVIWPSTETGAEVTKADLAAYVQAVGGALLGSVQDRPVTLQRFPTGITGEEFYSKNPPKGVPSWVRTTTCTYPSGRQHEQLVIDEVATALWAVQMNTITFHPWPVRTSDNDDPDEIRIDLDPQPGRTFGDIVEVALALREVMAGVGLTPFVKATGNRGVHVHAAIKPEWEFLEVRHAVIGIARELERGMPELVTTAWWKEERGDKIFVDFNQACRDRTLAAAYSPRPLPGAPVSTPLDWAELSGLDPTQFTIHTVPERLAEGGDPWAELHADPADLTAALALWEADVERGLGEMPFPPDYPKMPGEPRRVQPSRKRADG
ncbi:MAG: non-homologous end-joining DNA ligase [Ornithinimicrobium sp.]